MESPIATGNSYHQRMDERGEMAFGLAALAPMTLNGETLMCPVHIIGWNEDGSLIRVALLRYGWCKARWLDRGQVTPHWSGPRLSPKQRRKLARAMGQPVHQLPRNMRHAPHPDRPRRRESAA